MTPPVVIPPAGVYAIQNTETGRVYVGSSVNLAQRIHAHTRGLQRGMSSNPGIQADVRLYGPDAFVIVVLERVLHTHELAAREAHWAQVLQAFAPDVGYNERRITRPYTTRDDTNTHPPDQS
ncbi:MULTISPECIES: GIY-YIG nuclease family protein [unclassified Deinococcus]|uniref:GIY-YIG nuclease family protein n=1 Tax=unclassified Deinococcus TaxID=2623546 RepID=UPI001C2F980A|nr:MULTISPECIES: GIY-YIG nuclease family protein [unclassified Deinococcus]MDK2013526.1 GIY-YIG nuclease family protein [Deinococcus sp. 43]